MLQPQSKMSQASSAMVWHTPTNWSAVWPLVALGTMHLAMSRIKVLGTGWAGPTCVMMGSVFLGIALLLVLRRRVILIDEEKQAICIQQGIFNWMHEKRLAMDCVFAVRIVQMGDGSFGETTISILSESGELELPLCDSPRQKAVALAKALGVRLIRLYPESEPQTTSNRIGHLIGNDESGNN